VKKLYVINPISGGRSKKKLMTSVDCVLLTQYPGHAEMIARQVDSDVVVAVGGDGTVNEVARGILGTKKILGIVPFGSGNGLARHLGLSMSHKKALRDIENGNTVWIDTATVNDRLFLCTCGMGLDAEVGEQFAREKRRGLLTYIYSAVKVWKRFSPQEYGLTIDGRNQVVTASMITIGNASQWGNNAFITPDASVVDGTLDVTVVDPFRIIDIPLLSILLMTKHVYKSRKIHHFRGKVIDVHRQGEGVVHYDGEPVMMGADIHVEIAPKALNVIIPKR